MNTHTDEDSTVADVIDVLVQVLGIEDRADSLDVTTPLFGAIPELDSLGVVELAVALETRFDITISDDDFTGDVFETVGSLCSFVKDALDRP